MLFGWGLLGGLSLQRPPLGAEYVLRSAWSRLGERLWVNSEFGTAALWAARSCLKPATGARHQDPPARLRTKFALPDCHAAHRGCPPTRLERVGGFGLLPPSRSVRALYIFYEPSWAMYSPILRGNSGAATVWRADALGD